MKLPPFQQLLDGHGRDVHRFLVATVGHSDADDCYQETWLSALRAYPRLRDASNLRGWVFTIAHRKALDRLRARKRAPVAVGNVAELPAGSAPSTPAIDAEAIGQGEELWGAVSELPPKQRTAIALRFITDAGYAEISEVMRTSEEAARRNVHEGLKRLRTEYSHD